MTRKLVFSLLLAIAGDQGRNSDNPHCPLVFGIAIPTEGSQQVYFLPPYPRTCFVDRGEASLGVTDALVTIIGKPHAYVEVRCRERRPDDVK